MALLLEICICVRSFCISQPVSIVQPHKLPDSKLHDTSAILRQQIKKNVVSPKNFGIIHWRIRPDAVEGLFGITTDDTNRGEYDTN